MAIRVRKSKYGNVRTEIDGHRFASRREAGRYVVLKALLLAGEITALELQPRYPLRVAGVLVCTYVADFRYLDGRGVAVVEDAKGVRTDAYRIKKKLLAALYGVAVVEV